VERDKQSHFVRGARAAAIGGLVDRARFLRVVILPPCAAVATMSSNGMLSSMGRYKDMSAIWLVSLTRA
jgi:hypothetical protein